MRFNMNDSVKVKLTDEGRRIHRMHHDHMVKNITARGWKGLEYRPPVEDDDGWSTWQLWALMKDFGPHLSAGLRPPFETDIEIPERVTFTAGD